MSTAAREAWLLRALEVLNAYELETLSEGMPHSNAIMNIYLTLSSFFRRASWTFLMTSNLPVYYPGIRVFSPDLIAVRDVVNDPELDERMGWVVADEGRGIDLALEVLHSGDRQKDLIDNVLFYAQLGIPEYFVYDRKRSLLYGYRLPAPDSARYEPIPSRAGALRSRVLGLDLDIVEGRLRFFYNSALVPEDRELLARLQAKVATVEARADAQEQRAEEEARRADAEAQRADREAAARAEAERRTEGLERRLAELLRDR